MERERDTDSERRREERGGAAIPTLTLRRRGPRPRLGGKVRPRLIREAVLVACLVVSVGAKGGGGGKSVVRRVRDIAISRVILATTAVIVGK